MMSMMYSTSGEISTTTSCPICTIHYTHHRTNTLLFLTFVIPGLQASAAKCVLACRQDNGSFHGRREANATLGILGDFFFGRSSGSNAKRLLYWNDDITNLSRFFAPFLVFLPCLMICLQQIFRARVRMEEPFIASQKRSSYYNCTQIHTHTHTILAFFWQAALQK